MTTSWCQNITSTIGKPMPSRRLCALSLNTRFAFGAAFGGAAGSGAGTTVITAAGAAGSGACGASTVARLADGGVTRRPLLRRRHRRRHELRRDELIEVRQLADLLLLVHELRVGFRPLDELGVDLPRELDVR